MNNKNNKAAALRYNKHENNAPELIAAGKGINAKQIIKLAQENSIPLYSDPQLVERLINLPTSQEIPEELYSAVAQVLAFIYRVDQANKK